MTSPRVNLAGQRFGNYLAVDYAGRSSWNCICDCGAQRVVLTSNLRKGHSASCGCMKAEKSRAAATRHGLADTPVHRCWMSMRQRCQNPNDSAYENYGGRGIKVCERWTVFENFLADMGPMPPGYEIERDDVNGNYEPGNCRWATKKEQANNTRRNRLLTYQGRTQTLSQWAEDLGLKMHTLYRRVVIKKMPLDQAFRQKLLQRPRPAQPSLLEATGAYHRGRADLDQAMLGERELA